MITIEEMIVQGLYHKLVVVNVRRTPGARVDGLGLLFMGAVMDEIRTKLTGQGPYRHQDALPSTARIAIETGPSTSKSNDSVTTVSEVDDRVPDPDAPRQRVCLDERIEQLVQSNAMTSSQEANTLTEEKSTVHFKGDSTIEFSREVETVIDDGQVRMTRNVLSSTEAHTDFIPIIYLGMEEEQRISIPRLTSSLTSSQESLQSEGSQGDVGLVSNMIQSSNVPAVNLHNVNEFQIIQFMDKRDLSNPLVLVQTDINPTLVKPEEFLASHALEFGGVDLKALQDQSHHAVGDQDLCSSEKSDLQNSNKAGDSEPSSSDEHSKSKTSPFKCPTSPIRDAIQQLPSHSNGFVERSSSQNREADSGIWDESSGRFDFESTPMTNAEKHIALRTQEPPSQLDISSLSPQKLMGQPDSVSPIRSPTTMKTVVTETRTERFSDSEPGTPVREVTEVKRRSVFLEATYESCSMDSFDTCSEQDEDSHFDTALSSEGTTPIAETVTPIQEKFCMVEMVPEACTSDSFPTDKGEALVGNGSMSQSRLNAPDMVQEESAQESLPPTLHEAKTSGSSNLAKVELQVSESPQSSPESCVSCALTHSEQASSGGSVIVRNTQLTADDSLVCHSDTVEMLEDSTPVEVVSSEFQNTKSLLEHKTDTHDIGVESGKQTPSVSDLSSSNGISSTNDGLRRVQVPRTQIENQSIMTQVHVKEVDPSVLDEESVVPASNEKSDTIPIEIDVHSLQVNSKTEGIENLGVTKDSYLGNSDNCSAEEGAPNQSASIHAGCEKSVNTTPNANVIPQITKVVKSVEVKSENVAQESPSVKRQSAIQDIDATPEAADNPQVSSMVKSVEVKSENVVPESPSVKRQSAMQDMKSKLDSKFSRLWSVDKDGSDSNASGNEHEEELSITDHEEVKESQEPVPILTLDSSPKSKPKWNSVMGALRGKFTRAYDKVNQVIETVRGSPEIKRKQKGKEKSKKTTKKERKEESSIQSAAENASKYPELSKPPSLLGRKLDNSSTSVNGSIGREDTTESFQTCVSDQSFQDFASLSDCVKDEGKGRHSKTAPKPQKVIFHRSQGHAQGPSLADAAEGKDAKFVRIGEPAPRTIITHPRHSALNGRIEEKRDTSPRIIRKHSLSSQKPSPQKKQLVKLKAVISEHHYKSNTLSLEGPRDAAESSSKDDVSMDDWNEPRDMSKVTSYAYDSSDSEEYESAEERSASNLSTLSIDTTGSNISTEVSLASPFSEYEKNSEWMGNLPLKLHAVPLCDLAIPGSNVALAIESHMRTDMNFSKCNLEMAQFLRRLPRLSVFDQFRSQMKSIWKSWMSKQMLSMSQQLDAGVRYFDIRITKWRSAFYGEHGLYTRQLKRYLKEIHQFTDDHKGEVVILHFQSFEKITPKDKRGLVTLLFQVFGAKLCQKCPVEDLTLERLWKNKEQIITIFPDVDHDALSNHIFGAYVWSEKVVTGALPRKQTVPALIAYLDATYDEERKANMFHVTKAVLSPDLSMVFGEYHHKSTKELTLVETNDALIQWIEARDRLNVVSIDYVGSCNLVGYIIELNLLKKAETVV